jgi:hypothetical protein
MTPDEMLVAAFHGGSEWHCEERIKPALDAFFECWPGNRPRSPLVRRSHYAAARALTNEVGEMEAGAFIRWAATVLMDRPTLTIKDCRSLLFLVPEWAKREVFARKYEPCSECGAISGHSRTCSERDTE